MIRRNSSHFAIIISGILIFLVLPVAFFLAREKPIYADSRGPGVESSDPERFYHRLKFLRTKRPDDPVNTYEIANLYYAWQMEDEAIKEYRRCLKLDPNHLDAKWYLSHLLYSKGYFDEAFRLARDIIDKKTDDPENYYWAGEILVKLEQMESAREYFARCDELKYPGRVPEKRTSPHF